MSAKRLGMFLLWGVVAYVVLRIGAHFLPDPPQYIHLRQVKQHMDQIAQDWNTFRSTNSGLDLVSLYAETRGDGLFGMRGYVTSLVDVAQAIQFVESTHPPRPIYTNQIKVVDAESFAIHREILSERIGSPSISQPIHSKTNSTSSVMDSQR